MYIAKNACDLAIIVKVVDFSDVCAWQDTDAVELDEVGSDRAILVDNVMNRIGWDTGQEQSLQRNQFQAHGVSRKANVYWSSDAVQLG